jgi:hypothetical protein
MTLEEHMKEASHRNITVHDIVDSGSAFAMTEEGEMVFVNQRIVATVGLEPGGVYEAFLLPNYPDKREMIPWRALRVGPGSRGPRAEGRRREAAACNRAAVEQRRLPDGSGDCRHARRVAHRGTPHVEKHARDRDECSRLLRSVIH